MTNDSSNTPSNEVTCVLSLSGRNFDPEDVARRLALPDSRIWRRRSATIVGTLDLPDAAVEVAKGPLECVSTDVLASALLDELVGHEDRVLELAAQHDLMIALTCLVRVYTEPPSFVFSAKVVSALAALKAELSLDVIDLRDDDGDDDL